MSTNKIYLLYRKRFFEELKHLNTFCEHTPKLFEKFLEEKPKKEFNSFTKKDHKDLLAHVKKSKLSGKIPIKTKNKKLNQFLTSFSDASNTSQFMENNLPPIIFVYCVAKFEDFLKKIIIEYSLHNPLIFSRGTKIKDEKKTMSRHEIKVYDVLTSSDINELKSKIIKEKIDYLFYKNSLKGVIQIISKYYDLKIKTTKQLDEIFERRNLIVHNNGEVNEAYKKKYKSALINTDFKYLDSSMVEIGKFSTGLISKVNK